MTTGTSQPTVLVVDDEEDVRLLLRTLLELDGFDVVGEAVDGADALRQFEALDPPPVPDVVVMDNRMPVMTGLESASIMFRHRPDQVVVMCSAMLDDATTSTARDLGIAACVDKTRITRLPQVLRDVLAA